MSLLAPTVRTVTRLRTAGVFRDPRPLDQRRTRLEAASRTMPRPRNVTLHETRLADRRALRARPREVLTDTAVLYLHGGSHVAGSPTTHANLGARLARAAGCEVWLLDYRLAPEHPFPAGLDDTVAAALALHASGATRLVLAGDSAGAGLALAASARLVRDAATAPAGLLLLSPWLDLTLSGHSVRSRIDTEIMLDPATIADDARAYAGGRDLADPEVSPLFSSLAHLPLTLVQAGGRDILLADAERLADRAAEHGRRVDLQMWPDMWHVWQSAAPLLPEANAAIRQAGAWLRHQL